MSQLSKLAALENRFDGTIPPSQLRASRYPSALHAQLEEYRGQVEFYRGMVLQNVKSSKEWRRRGNIAMSQSTARDAWRYLHGWRVHRRNVAQIEEAIAARVEQETERQEREANSQFGVGA